MGRRINKNKIILLVVALITAILTFSIAVFGVSYNQYNDRNSESSADLVISSVTDLKNFATRVREGTSYSGKTVQLKNDIDCSTLSSFDPIGTRDNPFKGTFDGNGKTISNLPLCQNDYYEDHFLAQNTWCNYFGLFECIDGATIKNLHIDNANWTHSMGRSEDGLWGGILVGYARGSNNINSVLITNGSLILSEKENKGGVWNVGGLIGFTSMDISIRDCRVEVDINVKFSNKLNVGVMIGKSEGKGTSVSSCYVRSYLDIISYDTYFGGVCGYSVENISVERTYIGLQGGKVSNNYKTFSPGTHVTGTSANNGVASYYGLSNLCINNGNNYIYHSKTSFVEIVADTEYTYIGGNAGHISYTLSTNLNKFVAQATSKDGDIV
ncbi:MAG: hypothetical protein IKA36_05630 [Clostridia bacterium]|nr:hypothetical protein [Clostridia bacterium]